MRKFKLSKAALKQIESECDDTAGFLIKGSTVKFFIERAVNTALGRFKESFIVNCIIKTRPGDVQDYLFFEGNGTMQVCLDKYAIIPREEYEDLKKMTKDKV